MSNLPFDLPAADRAVADEALRDGGIVLFTGRGVNADQVQVTVRGCCGAKGAETHVAGYLMPVAARFAGHAIVSEQAARQLQLPVGVVGLLLSGAIPEDQQEAADEALTQAGLTFATRWMRQGFVEGLDDSFELYVERGYQHGGEWLIAILILASLAAVLMLGGTLTATFLSLADARPDLATLAAVGASPRRRRSIAMSYTLVIGLVGSTLGAAVAFIPGVATAYSATAGYNGEVNAHLIDVPWLMILAVVVGLPVFAAGVVGLTTRSRLPLVARSG